MFHPRSLSQIVAEIDNKCMVRSELIKLLEKSERKGFTCKADVLRARIKTLTLEFEREIARTEFDAEHYETPDGQAETRHKIALVDLQLYLLDLLRENESIRNLNANKRGRGNESRLVDWTWLLGYACACLRAEVARDTQCANPHSDSLRAAVREAEAVCLRWASSYVEGGEVPREELLGAVMTGEGLPELDQYGQAQLEAIMRKIN